MFSKKISCMRCKSKFKEDFSFCPFCGFDARNPEREMEDFGLLGRDNEIVGAPLIGGGGMGFTDRMFEGIFNSLVRALDSQMKAIHGDSAEVSQIPNGISVRIGQGQRPRRQNKRKASAPSITEEQIKRMYGMPRVEAKTDVRRLSDKVVYELKINDVESIDDIFVAKLAEGYEVKAIGKKKVYVNSLPIELPLKSYEITDKGIVFEFVLQ